LEPSDILALLTDGIADAERPDKNQYGTELTLSYFREYRRESAREIAIGLYRAVREFCAGLPQIDAITAVLCKVAESPE
jgi:serine phosphatase RsbU (regulator of sigma subunit)